MSQTRVDAKIQLGMTHLEAESIARGLFHHLSARQDLGPQRGLLGRVARRRLARSQFVGPARNQHCVGARYSIEPGHPHETPRADVIGKDSD